LKICAGKNRVYGTTYPQYTLTFYDGAQRKKMRFADLAKVRHEAEFTADKLASVIGKKCSPYSSMFTKATPNAAQAYIPEFDGPIVPGSIQQDNILRQDSIAATTQAAEIPITIGSC
jgi:hypothetical protein